MEKKKKRSKAKTGRARRSPPRPSHEELLAYHPLVCSIATYFSKLNAGIPLDDLIQEGWVGLMMGIRRYDPSRNISIGAFCNKYIFGRIYRSLIGTRNLVHNRRMVTMDEDCPVPEARNEGPETVDLLDGMGDELSRSVLVMLLEGHRKGEIMRRHRLTQEAWRRIIDTWMEKMAERTPGA